MTNKSHEALERLRNPAQTQITPTSMVMMTLTLPLERLLNFLFLKINRE